jgi:GxxExxY protein
MNSLNELSEAVLGCAFTVLNTLGAGFLEKVYENALAHELRKRGLAVAQLAAELQQATSGNRADRELTQLASAGDRWKKSPQVHKSSV